MALDGIVVANLAHELNTALAGSRISKIVQPEKDALYLTIKGLSGQYRVLMSASASLPLIYFTDKNKPSPLTAPNFCMLLRKYIGSARILFVTQPGLERIIVFHLEHLNETDIICLADRTVLEDRYAGIDRRIDYIIAKAERQGHPEHKPHILRKKGETKILIDAIEAFLGCSMDALMQGIDYENVERVTDEH